MADQNRKNKEDLENADYMGNMWGWKFSLIGLFVILIFVSIMIYGYQFKEQEKPEKTEPEIPAEKLEGFFRNPEEVNYDLGIS